MPREVIFFGSRGDFKKWPQNMLRVVLLRDLEITLANTKRDTKTSSGKK